MTTAITTQQPATVPALVLFNDQSVEMHGIGWMGYETLLKLRGGESLPKMIYVDGDLFLMSPALPHERLNRRMGFFMDQLILTLRLPSLQTGETTFNRRRKRGGVEGDHTYYFANEPRVRGKRQIDLQVDPPPDLAIEIVNTHSPESALKVYRRLGVPEVWVCQEDRMDILVRQNNGRYAEAESSFALPFLKSSEIADWMQRPYSGPDFEWMEEVHRWILEVLVPRVRELAEVKPTAIQTAISIPIRREDAIALAIRLIEKKSLARKASFRSIRDEEKNRSSPLMLRYPVEHRMGTKMPKLMSINKPESRENGRSDSFVCVEVS